MTGSSVSAIQATPAEQAGLRAVRRLVNPGEKVRVLVGDEMVELPPSLVQLLSSGAEVLDDGDTLAVVSEEAEVSPAEAAAILGVSRQYVDRLVAAEVLPVRRLPNSRYRKIPVRAVLAHKAVKERKRADIDQLVDTAVAAGLDY